MPYPNPAWSNKIWSSVWERVAASHGPEYLPRASRTKRGVVKAQEYGAGHYGVVSPCGVPGLVVKVTTDPTEASLVALLLTLYKGKEWLSGLVEYKDIVRVPEASHKGRGVWVLWREEAFHVGQDWVAHATKGAGYTASTYEAREARIFGTELGKFRAVASKLREYMKKERTLIFDYWKWREAEAMEDSRHWVGNLFGPRLIVQTYEARAKNYPMRLYSTLTYFAEQMSSGSMGVNVGECLLELLEKGIVLCDVHQGNIGFLAPDNERAQPHAPVITDPGHALVLGDKLGHHYIARDV